MQVSRYESDAYKTMIGKVPKRIPHWEALANPDFEQLVTGVDPWEKPRTARLKLLEKYKLDIISVYKEDKPFPKPTSTISTVKMDNNDIRARWDRTTTETWVHGSEFHSIEDVLSYEPLKHLDLREKKSIVVNRDYSLDDESFYNQYLQGVTEGNIDSEYEQPVRQVGFYNTLFMWPLLTFGWELFLELAGGYPEELKRILNDFAVINRKVFKTLARLDVDIVACHDDLCMTKGPVCSPAWLKKYIYPYYEEFFDIIHRGGKKVIFTCDANIDKVADDVITCGADGLISEPYTDWKCLARKYPDKLLAGEGDNRILNQDYSAIKKMVLNMVETAKMCNRYFMRIGNCIAHTIPAENVKLYFDLCKEFAYRE